MVNAVLASKQDRACRRLDDGIASLAAVVDRVGLVHHEALDVEVRIKGRHTDMLHATGYVDDAVEIAIIECVVIETRHPLGDVDAIDVHIVDAVSGH